MNLPFTFLAPRPSLGTLALALLLCSLGLAAKDPRHGPLKDLNGFFPFNPPATAEEWEERSEELKLRLLVANGLYPCRKRPPSIRSSTARSSVPVSPLKKSTSRAFPASRHRSAIPTGKPEEGQVARRALPARARRPLTRSGQGRGAQADRHRGGTLRGVGPDAQDRPLRHACPAGLRNLPLRYDGLRRQPSDLLPTSPPLFQATARFRGLGQLGAVQRSGRAQAPVDLWDSDLEFPPGPRFPRLPARRRRGPYRGHRRQWRRHPDHPAGGPGPPAHCLLPQRHGLQFHAGRVHLRERKPAEDRNGQRRACRPLRPQAHRHDRSRRLDPGNARAGERLSRDQETLSDARQARECPLPRPHPLQAQLQLRPAGRSCIPGSTGI